MASVGGACCPIVPKHKATRFTCTCARNWPRSVAAWAPFCSNNKKPMGQPTWTSLEEIASAGAGNLPAAPLAKKMGHDGQTGATDLVICATQQLQRRSLACHPPRNVRDHPLRTQQPARMNCEAAGATRPRFISRARKIAKRLRNKRIPPLWKTTQNKPR